MSKKKELDEVISNLKKLVILYGEVTDELINNLEETNRLLEEANNDVDKLHKENEKLVSDYNSLLEDYNNLDEEKNKKMAKIAELKQKKIPDIETITKLMNELQDMLMKATNKSDLQNTGEGGNDEDASEGEGATDSPPVFDLSKDKASDEDGFTL